MPDISKRRRKIVRMRRAAIEITFIVFLFYANLLMGDFTASKHIKSFSVALRDIVTPTNFGIAVVCAVIGYIVFESLREKL